MNFSSAHLSAASCDAIVEKYVVVDLRGDYGRFQLLLWLFAPFEGCHSHFRVEFLDPPMYSMPLCYILVIIEVKKIQKREYIIYKEKYGNKI